MTLLDPASWPADDVAASLDRGQRLERHNPASGRGARGAVVGSTGPFAQLTGRYALAAGGNSVDAAVTTAMSQIALAAGCWVSYAGIFTVVHFDAASGQVSSLVAPFKTCAGEHEPATIPRMPEPSGRTAMVPGFFAGAWALHERFGTLPWSDVLTPATWIAERGFPVDAFLARTMRQRRDVILRTPEGRAVFGESEQQLPREGELFRQPELARVLRRVQKEGIDDLYQGEWARRFVDVVRREGGAVTLEDLASYAPVWQQPTRSSFRGHDVYGTAAPGWGGAAVAEALNLIECSGTGDPAADPAALRTFVEIARQGQLLSHLPAKRRSDPAHARELWVAMQSAGGPVAPGEASRGTCSDFVVAADADGNMTAVCHSINTVFWGLSGLFVDGISIPDAASYQQALLATVPPGENLPTPPEPGIALKDGRPALAFSSIGSGLHEVTVQCVSAVLSGHADLVEAVNRPVFHGPDYIAGDSISDGGGVGQSSATGIDATKMDGVMAELEQRLARLAADGTPAEELMLRLGDVSAQVVEDGFSAEHVETAAGGRLKLRRLPGASPAVPRGHWGGIAPGSDGGWVAARTPFAGGAVEVL